MKDRIIVLLCVLARWLGRHVGMIVTPVALVALLAASMLTDISGEVGRDHRPQASHSAEARTTTATSETNVALGDRGTNEEVPSTPTGVEVAEPKAEVVNLDEAQLIGNWTWYGYKLNWSETNQLANLSLWNAYGAVASSRLIPYSSHLMWAYSATWIQYARTARMMGKCVGIYYVGTPFVTSC
jgi:hypothetical protein